MCIEVAFPGADWLLAHVYRIKLHVLALITSVFSSP